MCYVKWILYTLVLPVLFVWLSTGLWQPTLARFLLAVVGLCMFTSGMLYVKYWIIGLAIGGAFPTAEASNLGRDSRSRRTSK
jgi:uncharacterized membrane protein YqaE (UPF0057 family)